MKKDSRIYVAGHTGMAGSAIVRELERKGYENILAESSHDYDLTGEDDVEGLFNKHIPEYVFLAAAHAGGIKEAIDKPGEMLYHNILIQTNVIEACRTLKVKKLINLGSSCMYPIRATQPYREEYIGDGKTDENWSYAVAKLAGLELCRAYHRQYGCNFMTVLPCNMYGYNDSFDLDKAHVIPALIRKFHEGNTVEVWGHNPENNTPHHKAGGGLYSPHREFLWSDDFAEAVVMLMEKHDYDDLYDGVINIGYGLDVEIQTVLWHLQMVIGKREIVWNPDKPLGVRSKLLDISRIKALGWESKTSLREGLEKLNDWFKTKVSYLEQQRPDEVA